jgi:uncharacterized membrane protein YbhN (UPF0104 family)
VESLRKLAGSFWVRLAVSLGLLAAVASRIDFGDARSRISAGSWYLFSLAAAVTFGSFLVAAVRWRILLAAAGLATTRFRALRAYLIGVFTMNFLPSSLGGDVARAYIVSRPGSRILAGATVVADRITALVCLVALGFVATAADPGAVPGELVLALGAAAAGIAAGCIGVWLAVRFGERLAPRLPTRLRDWGASAAAAIRACLRRDVLSKTFLLGLVFQLLVVFSLWLVARSLRMHLAYSLLAVVLPLVLLVSALPISIGGLGVREWTYVVTLSRVGVSATDATILSLATTIANGIAGLPGAVMLLARPSASLPLASRDRHAGIEEGLPAAAALTNRRQGR